MAHTVRPMGWFFDALISLLLVFHHYIIPIYHRHDINFVSMTEFTWKLHRYDFLNTSEIMFGNSSPCLSKKPQAHRQWPYEIPAVVFFLSASLHAISATCPILRYITISHKTIMHLKWWFLFVLIIKYRERWNRVALICSKCMLLNV